MRRCCLTLAMVAFLIGPRPTTIAQGFDWQNASPEQEGLSSRALAAIRDRLAESATKAFFVVRNDRLVHESYSSDHSPVKPHYTASMAKAIVGGLSIAVALTDGRLTLEDRVAKHVPQWAADPRKSRITIRHLGSHTSGLDDAEAGQLPHETLTGWQGDFWKRLAPPNDPFTIARDRTPVLFEPGERFQYSNPGIAMLTYALTSALPQGGERDARTLLRDRVMRPIGVNDGEWSIGYAATDTVEGLPLVAAWGGGGYTARAVARVGRLMLREGDWDGSRILAREAVRRVTTDAGTPGHGAIGWWSNAEGRYPKLPRDAFWGSGAGHQVVLVIPSLRLIAVRNGASLGATAEHHDMLNAVLFTPLVEAVESEPSSPGSGDRAAPYLPSPVIERLSWAPPETIRRDARGSDNWPLTWADDGAMYGAYGDGQGFMPIVPRKLSMGFARIAGDPTDFAGMNIRSASGETFGDGAKGKKASGMLMVNGVLYMWVRNAANSQLAWSTDRGATWTWSDWAFTHGFGAPTFLNFGRNYAGARDRFVYVYSHDADSAYVAADRMVLARVPSGRVRERAAYEFFKGHDARQQPVWTRAVDERGAVFSSPGRCYRSGITYNAGLRRYLWSQSLPGDGRFQGGFGVYDAPEPWGPWSTVFFTERWDVGPGDTSSFPTKWISADGLTVHLVFSGDDAFSVRKATIVRRASR
jgi:CubicO group peptidase (beta-lactamase class C family)